MKTAPTPSRVHDLRQILTASEDQRGSQEHGFFAASPSGKLSEMLHSLACVRQVAPWAVVLVAAGVLGSAGCGQTNEPAADGVAAPATSSSPVGSSVTTSTATTPQGNPTGSNSVTPSTPVEVMPEPSAMPSMTLAPPSAVPGPSVEPTTAGNGGADNSGGGGAGPVEATGGAPPLVGGSGGNAAGNAGAQTNGGGGSVGQAGVGPVVPLPEDDRCDIAVYDPNAPPQALTLAGSLGVHDPVVMEQDGTFYLFATGNQLAAKTSPDLLAWDGAPEIFEEIDRPAWIGQEVPGVSNLWAPDISYFGGQYHLYYSASTFGENTSCIGHLTRASLNAGQWTAENAPTFCSSSSDDFNAIDPNVVLDTAGTAWLSFGSFWDGIRAFELDAAGQRVGTELHALASRGGAGIEAPFIVRRCGYYYLFTSWDRCCQGADSTYNIRVGRSEAVLGPYLDDAGEALLDGGGTLLVEGDDTWKGPGHSAVIFSGDRAYDIHHAYAASNGASRLRISELAWDDQGWPISGGP